MLGFVLLLKFQVWGSTFNPFEKNTEVCKENQETWIPSSSLKLRFCHACMYATLLGMYGEEIS